VIRGVAVLVALAGLLSGCGGLPTEFRIGPPPACNVTWTPPAPSSRGQLLLIAQSVPEASMIPCLGPLPAGWEFTDASIDSSRTRLSVATDTFDLDVGIELLSGCEFSSAEQIPSRTPNATLYSLDRGQTLLYRFDGGCVRVVFPTMELATSKTGRALFDEIHLMTRDELRQLSGWEL
jgi:hypothetical protein